MKAGLAFLLILAGLPAPCRADALLTEAVAGASHVVAVGERVELRLAENPSTGFVWAVDVDPAAAASVVADRSAKEGALPGAPGVRKLTIEIKRPGPLLLRARLWRAWEGEASVVKRLEFSLVAR